MKIKCCVCDCEIDEKHVYGEWDDYCSDCWESEGRDTERWEDESEWEWDEDEDEE